MINAYVGYETTVYLTDNPLFQFASILLAFLCFFLISSHCRIIHFLSIHEKTILLFIHIVFAMIMLTVILSCNYQPTAAQAWTLDAAQRLLDGDYSFWSHSGFNYIYPQLNALTLYLVPFVFLFGKEGASIAYQIFNLVMLLLSSYSIYGFCKETHLNPAKTTLAFIIYLPLGFYIFFVYGNIASLSLSLYSIWKFTHFLSTNHKSDMILSAFSIVLAIFFKETGIITLIAMTIFLILDVIYTKKWKNFLWLLFLSIFYILLSFSINTTIERITNETVSDGMSPYGHLTMGLSESDRANGWYNNYTFDTLVLCDYNYDQYAVITKEAFYHRFHSLLDDPLYTTSFFASKTASQWNNPTFQSIWIQQQMLNAENRPLNLLCIDGSTTNMIFYYIFNILQSFVLFSSLCYFIFDSQKKSLISLLPAVIFIGGFLFLLFWEAKAQYTILFFIHLLPYSTSGFLSLFRRLIALRDNPRWFSSKVILFLGILIVILLLTSVNTPFIKKTIRLGTSEADAYYNYYLEQNVYQHK